MALVDNKARKLSKNQSFFMRSREKSRSNLVRYSPSLFHFTWKNFLTQAQMVYSAKINLFFNHFWILLSNILLTYNKPLKYHILFNSGTTYPRLSCISKIGVELAKHSFGLIQLVHPFVCFELNVLNQMTMNRMVHVN